MPAAGGGEFPVILLAEAGEVAFEDGVEVAVATRNVPVRCRAHINIYGRNIVISISDPEGTQYEMMMAVA